jgi:uncharacterized membrane protein YfcA
MEYFVLCLVAFAVSGLTLFSGFGLGTILMPAFALFFPVPVAIAATAVVHLANNLFKTFLVGSNADWAVVAKFAIPGAAAAILGAMLLNVFDSIPSIFSYQIGEKKHEIILVKMVIGLLIVGFAFLDLLPPFENLSFHRKYLPLGGLLSGFFGGLSGMQGALRAAFLIRVGLSKEAFIGTGTVSAVIVDAARLLVYGLSIYTTTFTKVSSEMSWLIITATLAAFLGSFTSTRLMKKVTLRTVQIIVGVMLIIIGAGMAGGLF